MAYKIIGPNSGEDIILPRKDAFRIYVFCRYPGVDDRDADSFAVVITGDIDSRKRPGRSRIGPHRICCLKKCQGGDGEHGYKAFGC